MARSAESPVDALQNDPHRAFIKLIHQNSLHHRVHTVFADFCEISALSISNALDRQQYDVREKRYLEIVAAYNRDELNRFAQMLACVVEALEGGMHDCLGQLFMSLDLGSHWRGQFFSPYSVAQLMGKMVMGQVTDADIAAAGGFITLNEPAAGAGAMVIAAAHALHDAGVNYQRCLHVTAQDIDRTAVHMCFLQLALLHVPAIVVLGNSLALEEREHWVTPAHIIGGWDRKLLRRQRDEQNDDVADNITATAPTTATESRVTPCVDDLAAVRSTIVEERIRKAEQMSLF